MKTSIKTETKSGVPVELIIYESGVCKAIVQHPKFGEVSGFGEWGSLNGDEGFIISTKIKKRQTRVNIAVSKKDFQPIANAIVKNKVAKKEADKKRDADMRQAALNECPIGYTIARCLWTNGDLMSGEYQTEDGTKILDQDMLENHHGWYFIPQKSVDEKKAQIAKKEEMKANAEKKEADRVERIFETAKATGEKQVLRTFSIDCQDPHEECNTDIVTVYAMPDGSKTETCVHTY